MSFVEIHEIEIDFSCAWNSARRRRRRQIVLSSGSRRRDATVFSPPCDGTPAECGLQLLNTEEHLCERRSGLRWRMLSGHTPLAGANGIRAKGSARANFSTPGKLAPARRRMSTSGKFRERR